MVAFPNGKINLGLHVIEKRGDGFHNIETVFYPVGIYDVMEVIDSTEHSFQSFGISIEGPAAHNLCLKALHLLKKDNPHMRNVAMALYKNIPVGAGLGGGSSDAVSCLKLINTVAQLNLSDEQLSNYALQLGSDCPFFVSNKPCFAEGRGEILSAIELDLSTYAMLVVNPAIHINTQWAFSALSSFTRAGELRAVITAPVESWKNNLVNDFEVLVNQKHPETKKIKDQMYSAGAVYASLSGTGSTVYGLFARDKKPDIPFPPAYFVKWL